MMETGMDQRYDDVGMDVIDDEEAGIEDDEEAEAVVEPPVVLRCCPEGHTLSTLIADGATTLFCDRCSAAISKAGTAVYSCTACDYDLCAACAYNGDGDGTAKQLSNATEEVDDEARAAADEARRARQKENELKRLARHEDYFAETNEAAGGEAGATGASGAREDSTSGALRASTVLYENFALPPASLLGWPVGLQGSDSRAAASDRSARFGTPTEEEHVLGMPLRRLLQLVQTVHEWVNTQRSGRIDWEAIARRMSRQRPGQPPPPFMTASEAHRLWRLLAYRMAAPPGLFEAEPPPPSGPKPPSAAPSGSAAPSAGNATADAGAPSSSTLVASASSGLPGGASEAAATTEPRVTEPLAPTERGALSGLDGGGEGSAAVEEEGPRPKPPARLEDVDLEADSDVDEYIRQSQHNEQQTQQQIPAKKKVPRNPVWCAKGAPRLVGRPYPRAPGVVRPKIAADGSGPLDLGLEPPRKVQRKLGRAAKDDESDTHTLQAALSLRVTTKPWSEEEDRKLAAAVLKHGSQEKKDIEKVMKRGWPSILARMKKLQENGALPPGVIPPAVADAPADGDGAKPAAPSGGKVGKAGGKAGAKAAAAAAGGGGGGGGGALAVDGAKGGKAGKTSAKDKGGGAAKLAAADKAAAEALAAAEAAAGPKPLLDKMTKPQARGLKGKYIEIFWDGEAAWFEAEVLNYDDKSRMHFVRYTEDEYECEELLSGPTTADGPAIAVWRPCIKTTSRGAAVKAERNAAAKAAAGLVDAPA